MTDIRYSLGRFWALRLRRRFPSGFAALRRKRPAKRPPTVNLTQEETSVTFRISAAIDTYTNLAISQIKERDAEIARLREALVSREGVAADKPD